MATAHAIAAALDEYLRLTDPDQERRRSLECYLGSSEEPDMPPALSALARLRWEAEQEVNRLIALMDAIDADPDLEPSLGSQPPGQPLDGEIDAGEEPEDDLADQEPSWPESAGAGPLGLSTCDPSDDDEDSDPACELDDDSGLATPCGAVEQGFGDAWMRDHHLRVMADFERQEMQPWGA